MRANEKAFVFYGIHILFYDNNFLVFSKEKCYFVIMKIILATPVYPPEIGGPATYTKELCAHIAGTHNITVVAYTDSSIPFPGTVLVSVSKRERLIIRILKYIRALWVASRGADLIYVQSTMAAGFPVAIVSMFLNVPFVLKFVGDEAWERATQHRLTEKRLEDFFEKPEGNVKIRIMMVIQGFVLRRAAIVTTPSVYLSEVLIKKYNIRRDRIVVNYNAAEKTEKAPFAAQRVKYQIVTTARLVAWKGIDGIIKATSILKKKFPDVRLVVAGEGPELENLKKLAQETGVADSVIFLGNISRAETWHLRKNSEVYVLNSTYEGLPHTVLTSFAAQIPVVATNISGTNEVVYHEKTGLLVKPGNDISLASAIERLFIDSALSERLVQGGTKILNEKFSWQSHIKILDNIFKSVLAKPSNKF